MENGFDQAQRMANLWVESATRMATAAMAFRPEQPPVEAAREVRDAQLTAAAQHVDHYMRSPQFLESVKRSLDAAIAFRKQLNELLTQAHHSVQSVARQDVDALQQSVRHLETRVLDRIEDLAKQIEGVSRRLDAIGSPDDPGSDNGHGERRQAAAVRTISESETE